MLLAQVPNVVVAIVLIAIVLLFAWLIIKGPSLRETEDEAYEFGRSLRQQNKGLAYAADAVGVLLILGAIWYFLLK